jgi:catechol 2,3-dioxygenase-like lactoylglutathione lyase family enzyme
MSAAPNATPHARIDRIRLNAADPEALSEFFAAALGFTPASDGLLHLGETRLEIARAPPGAAPAPGSLPGDNLAFQHFAIATPDLDAAYARLRASPGWKPISRGGPQHLPQREGGAVAFKFLDPEGHPLELIAFPGRPPRPPYIDHSAISVSNGDASIAFYEGVGFAFNAAQDNFGPEQDALDDIVGARVRIISLHGVKAPNIELLAYSDSHPRAARSSRDDILATRLVLAAPAGGSPARLIEDPDGHLSQIGG